MSFFRKSAGWLFFYHSPACIVECISEYIFLISKKKQAKTKSKERNKETREEKRISLENWLKKIKFCCPSEYFSHHPHFQKKEIFSPRYNHVLSLCFHSHYIEYKNLTQDILIPLLSLLVNRINGGWGWWIVSVVWLTDEKRLALFPSRTIVKDPHHREPPTRREQDYEMIWKLTGSSVKSSKQ